MTRRGAVTASAVTLVATVLLFISVQHPNPVPKMPPGQATPLPHAYDEDADPHAAVDFAFAQARENGHKVMLNFGANWCSDSRMLAGVLDQPAVQQWLANGFETVTIDVGHLTKNLDIAARWGVRVTATPTVLFVSPPGRLLNPGSPFALTHASTLSSQAIVDLLGKMSRS